MDGGAWWAAVHGVANSQIWLSDFTFTFHFHALEKELATQSSVLAWRIPGTGEPSGLQSMGSHRVRHDWSDLAAAEHWLARECAPGALPSEVGTITPILYLKRVPQVKELCLRLKLAGSGRAQIWSSLASESTDLSSALVPLPSP